MITKISLKNVASYKNDTTLNTDKKVNLIYGLNGTGKSTLSNYLYNIEDPNYLNCSITPTLNNNTEELLVYNQKFITGIFYESELKGIFSLSKENKEAKDKIDAATKEVEKLEKEKEKKNTEKTTIETDLAIQYEKSKKEIWKIKTNYTGGDRVLEFCLEGYKSDGNKLLAYIISLIKPEVEPAETIEKIKEEAQMLNDSNVQKFSEISIVSFSANIIEENQIFSKIIVGNATSSVSDLITKLENADWVKNGLKYMPQEIGEENKICPFCQQKTISRTLLNSIKDYFDESYEKDISSLRSLLEQYKNAKNVLPTISIFENVLILKDLKQTFDLAYSKYHSIIETNISSIEKKIQTPSIPISLINSQSALDGLNVVLEKANSLIKEFNNKIDKKGNALSALKISFWNIMRWKYDQTISPVIQQEKSTNEKIKSINTIITQFDNQIKTQQAIILEQQKNVVNIEEAITNINTGLLDLGIDDFKIEKYSNDLYKIARGDKTDDIFRSLSEGEKMIISFLYFIELCKGKKEATEAAKKKIVIIDDPISSLSHIYIFNVGRLIHQEFLRSNKYEQVFVLTHSLYFFYELADTNKTRREECQKLFRLQKNNDGSHVIEMKYEEIQNDYHAYWNIIKDKKQSPALIANCMRNIIEYFFNFVEKKDLNNVFQKPALKAPKYQAFNRYINRESHSLGQNIFDIKEFNYTDFKEAFALVFTESGYEEHYKKLIK